MSAFFPALRLRVMFIAGFLVVMGSSVSQVALAQSSAPNEWTWMGGSKTIPTTGGVYGTLGTPAAANIPGTRVSASAWTDANGNLWLFGGLGSDASDHSGPLNDWWEFNPSINQWVWMGGSSTLLCNGYDGTPICGGGLSDAANWTDSSGNPWLFGGFALDTTPAPCTSDLVVYGYVNVLSELNASTEEWPGIGGSGGFCQPGVYGTLGTPASANNPGGRGDAMTWRDSSGNLWLFGGDGYDANGKLGYLNDLWEVNPSTREWTWMGGSSTLKQMNAVGYGRPGVYGTQGTPTATNIPGSRSNAMTWTDKSGNFWLFGGQGFDADSNWDTLGDLWEFSPSKNEWTWMGGKSTVPCQVVGSNIDCHPESGVYGTLGTPAATNMPGARFGAMTWTDSDGNFWLFGGQGYDATVYSGYLNDLWEFNPSTMEWAWMGGSNAVNQPGVYGTLGTHASANNPGARQTAVTWIDLNGNFWLFAGEGYADNGNPGGPNDLWEYQPQAPISAPTLTVTPSASSITPVQPLTVTISVRGAPFGVAPTGSVTLSGGGYTSAATAITSGSVTIGVPAGSLANGSDTLTASYTPDSTSSPYFTAATATTTIIVTGTTPQTITFSAIAAQIVGTPLTLSATSTSGLKVTFTSATQTICTVSGTTATFIFSGNCTIDANQAGNSVYEAAPQIQQSFTVNATALNGWTWMGGNSSFPLQGSYWSPFYGSQGVPGVYNNPGGLLEAASWTDKSGNLWLFGGSSNSSEGPGNGLWNFNPSINEWTWLTGGQPDAECFTYPTSNNGTGISCGQPGVYGTLGTPAPGNLPGTRIDETTWTDRNGNTWLFGGMGSDSFNNPGPPSYVFYSGLLNDLWEFNPSTQEWAWMGGSNTLTCEDYFQDTYANNEWVCGLYSSPAVYGTLGVPAAGNIPDGFVTDGGAASWTDRTGNFWIFGNGEMWEFNPPTMEWAWMGTDSAQTCLQYSTGIDKTTSYCTSYSSPPIYGTLGTPAAGNNPAGRTGAATWTDKSGNLWLFGGNGSDANLVSGPLNDLWEFNPSTMEWAWMGGSSTIPSGGCIGSSICGQHGVYGSQGILSAGNIPGARYGAVTWTDNDGNFWLFGGYGCALYGAPNSAQTECDDLQDLWEFNPSTMEWAWMAGNSWLNGSENGQAGVYGTLGTPTPGSNPGGRFSASNWTDGNGNFWLFGGHGYDMNGSIAGINSDTAPLNDLWEYRPLAPIISTSTVTVTLSVSSVTSAQPLTVTISVSGGLGGIKPTGSVTLSGGGYTSAATTLTSGSATIIVPAGSLAYGSDTLTASYTPDSKSSSYYSAATGNATIDVTGTTPQTITFTDSLPASITYPNGISQELSATGGASGNPVTFSLVSGPATLSGAALLITGKGTVVVAANQAGNATYAAAPQVQQSMTVNGEPQTITFGTIAAQAVGTPLTLSATSTFGLTVTFTSATQTICTVSGTTATFLASGTCTIDANQAGDSVLAAAPQVQQSFTVNGEAQTITFGAIAVQAVGTPLTLSATSTSGLAVTFTSATQTICTVSGTTATFIASGTCTIDANQAGNSAYAAAPMVQQSFAVNLASSFTLSSSPTTVSIAQGGNGTTTITLTDVGSFSGAVSLSASGLPGGVIASFAGGSTPASQVLTLTASNTAAVTSTPVTVTITGTSGSLTETTSIALTITAEPGFTAGSGGTTSMTLTPGATTGNTGTISAAGTNGFAGTVNLTCAVSTTIANGNDPPTCSLNPASLSLSGTAAQTSTLTVATTAATSAALVHPGRPGIPWYAAGGATLAGLLLFGIPARRRRWQTIAGMLVLLVVLSEGLIACGSGGGGSSSGGGGGTPNPGTTEGTYTLTVTGTGTSSGSSASVTATVGSVTLTVN